MKKIIALSIALFCSIIWAFGQGKAEFTFANSSDTYNFGTVTDGEVVVHDYTFTNTGNIPLIIYKAEVSCNCTSAEWPKAPIAPGKTGVIKVSYKSEGNVGKVNKQIYIKSNAALPAKFKSRYEIVLLGNVAAKK